MKISDWIGSASNYKFGIITAAISFAMLTTAFADRASLSGFPSLVIGGQTAHAPIHQFDKPFDNLISAPPLLISLEKTSIAEISDAFGGRVQSRILPDASTRWLCYEVTADNVRRRIWFIAQGAEQNSDDAEIVNFVSTELATDHIPECDAPRQDITKIVLPVPTLKDDVEALKERFGTEPKEGFVRYANEQKQENGQVRVQSLVYRVHDGKIDGIAFSQATSSR